MTKTIAIVGAGVTGLVAAYRLQQQGYTVRVLEARQRFGGRTYTIEIPVNGVTHHFDLGAHFIGNDPAQQPIWDLVEELGLKTFEQYEGPENAAPPPYWAGEGANLQYFHGQPAPEAYIGTTIPNEPASQFYLYYLDQLVSGVRLDAPELTDNAAQLDQLSVWDWVTHVNLPGYGPAPDEFKSLTRMLCRVGFSTEPENISTLWLLFYVASSGGLARFQDIRWPLQGAQGYRLVEGAQSIANTLAKKLLTADPQAIETSTQVTQIDNQPTVQTVSYTDTFGHFKTLTADRTLVAMAPAVSATLKITNLDPNRQGLPNAMQNSNMFMTFVTFKTPFWRQDTTTYTSGKVNGIPTQNISRYGLSGDALLADEDVVWIMDNTSAEGLPALFAFIVGDAAVKWRQQTKAARETMVKGYMTKMFGSQVGSEAIDYYEHDWNGDEFSKGCPAGHYMPGEFLKYGPHTLLNNFKPTNGLYYASTETALRSNGYMSGAVWSGETVAKQITADLSGTTPERDPVVREQAMKFCVERVIKAVQMQNPMMEFSVISPNCIFDAPGGQALSGTYTGQQGTIEFFVTLGSLVTITRFNVEGITLNEAQNCAFARISVSGHSNVTGTTFAGLTGTMAFLFNDPSEAEVVIAKDMLLLDTPLADEVILGIPQTVSTGAPPPASSINAELNLDKIAASLGITPGGPFVTAETVIVGAGGKVSPHGPYLGAPAWVALASQMDGLFTKVTNVGSALDEATRSIYVLFQVAGRSAVSSQAFDMPMILDIELTNGNSPSAKRITVRLDGTKLDA